MSIDKICEALLHVVTLDLPLTTYEINCAILTVFAIWFLVWMIF